MSEFVVGLTGGIGSGKSSVAGMFEGLGVPVIDSDQVARELSSPGRPEYERIVAEFGPEILAADDRIDRRRLGEIVFADPSRRRALERILHPAIKRVMDQRAEQMDAPYCLLEIPLLVETGRWRDMDRVLVVEADEAVRTARLQERGLPDSRIRRIIATQASAGERRAVADDVIDNNSGTGALKQQVERLHRLYLALAKQKREGLRR